MTNSKPSYSALKAPLNDILGSKGHLRVLRYLTDIEYPIGRSELLDRTTLSRQGVYDVVERLAEYGIVKYVGSGSNQQILLRKEHPLSKIISRLFEAEKKRYDNLLDHLKEEINSSTLKPKSAWIFGKVAQDIDEYGDPIRVALLGEVETVDEMTEDLRSRIYNAGISKKYDITIEIIGVTKADLESGAAMISEPIILLWSIDPRHLMDNSESKTEELKTHEDFDRRSLADGKAWSKLLKTYPEIIPRSIEHLNGKDREAGAGEHRELMEWRQILESMSYQRLKKFLESDSERSVRLRQSLPFWQVLNERERAKLEELKSHE